MDEKVFARGIGLLVAAIEVHGLEQEQASYLLEGFAATNVTYILTGKSSPSETS